MAVELFTQRTRPYQLEMFERSMEGNRIVVMDTGSALCFASRPSYTDVLLRRSRHLYHDKTKADQTKRVWFLAPTVELCIQQHNVLALAMPAYKMRLLTGLDNVDKWSEQSIWDSALDGARVVVSTHAVLADALRHAFVQLSTLALLVFDEAHHCIKKHPANIIMRDFYHPTKARLGSEAVPHILGLSASLIMSSKVQSLPVIENNLDSISVAPRSHRQDLLQHVYRPHCSILRYHTAAEQTEIMSHGVRALCKLISHYESQCLARSIDLKAETATDTKTIEARQTHIALTTLRRRALHLIDELGLWSADYFVLETIRFLRAKVKSMPEIEMDIKESTQLALLALFDQFGIEAACRSSSLDITETVSAKVKCLIDYLLAGDDDDLCGIVFVTQRVVASVLSVLLSTYPVTKTQLRCTPFVGTSNASGRKFTITELVDFRLQKTALQRFRVGDANLVIATSVLEEGIDVQACNVVACFDAPTNLKSFIQRRGRARHQQSRLGVLVPVDESILARFEALEAELNAVCQSDRQQLEPVREQNSKDETMDYVLSDPSTGARLDADSTLSHLYHFCEQLSHGGSVDNQPDFVFETVQDALVKASVTLPDTVPARVRRAESKVAWKTEHAARKDAAFHAYAALYDAGLINHNLLPLSHDWNVQSSIGPQAAFGQISIEPQLDVWSVPECEGEYSATECQITVPTHLRDGIGSPIRLLLLTCSRILVPPPLSLYWDVSSSFCVSFAQSQSRPTVFASTDEEILHAATVSIYRAPRSKRSWDQDGTLAAFLVPDMSAGDLKDWLATSSQEPTADSLFGQPGKRIVRVPMHDHTPYVCKNWIENSAGRGVICEGLPRRRNFLLQPTPGNNKSEAEEHHIESSRRLNQIYPLEGCTFVAMPLSWARAGLFMPAIFQHIQDYTAARIVMSSLLSSIPVVSHEHILAALCAPSASRPVHYQRYEFLGDSVLKFITSCSLFNTFPDWPEGYLTQRRSSLICNSTLTTAALSMGLDRYIITQAIDYRHWTLPVMREAPLDLTPRQISSKVLADVVEALIGAVWLDLGMPAAIQCVRLFIPSVPANFDFDTQHVSPLPKRGFAKCHDVEALIGYTFSEPALLLEALTHPSYGRYLKGNSYERLEFLGDAVLDMMVTNELAIRISRLSQGQMTKIKAALVNARLLGFLCLDLRRREHHRAVNTTDQRETVQATCVREVSLASYMYFSSEGLAAVHQSCDTRYQDHRTSIWQELLNGKRFPWVELSLLSINKVFSDLVESILGAIFLDAGQDLGACVGFIEKLGFQGIMKRVVDDQIDVSHPRDRLQRRVGARALSIVPSRGALGASYGCEVAVDGNVIVQVEDCFDEDQAVVMAVSKAEELLAADM